MLTELREKIAAELPGYQLYYSVEDVPENMQLPSAWAEFGLRADGRDYLPPSWLAFAELLPGVSAWLRRSVIGTVLAISDRPYLLYVFSEDGALYFYMGGVPVSEVEINALENSFMPGTLRRFYTDVHNGFGFHLGCTMGPSRLEDFVSIKDLCDEDIAGLPDMIGIFSSGAGDYLCLDSGKPATEEALIWWHENPEDPEMSVDLWATMDAWMSIFLENSADYGTVAGPV